VCSNYNKEQKDKQIQELLKKAKDRAAPKDDRRRSRKKTYEYDSADESGGEFDTRFLTITPTGHVTLSHPGKMWNVDRNRLNLSSLNLDQETDPLKILDEIIQSEGQGTAGNDPSTSTNGEKGKRMAPALWQ